jgi:hypothetical protein
MTIRSRLARSEYETWLTKNKAAPNLGALFLKECFYAFDPDVENATGSEAEKLIEKLYVESKDESCPRPCFSGVKA